MSVFFLKHPDERDLALFAGGEAGPFARWRIERHLETCASCKSETAGFFHLQEELSPLAELPDVDWNALAESIEAALPAADEAAGEERRSRVHGWGYGLAAVGAAVVLALVVQAPWSEPDSAPVAQTASLEVQEKKLEQPRELAEAFDSERSIKSDVRAEAEAAGASAVGGRLATEDTKEEAAKTADADKATELDQLAAAELRGRADLAPSASTFADSAAGADRIEYGREGFTEIVAVSNDGVLTITEVYAQ